MEISILMVVIFFAVFPVLSGLLFNFIAENEIFLRKCENCRSNEKEIKGEYWDFGKYAYHLYCANCGCHLEYNYGIPEDEYRKLLRKCKEKGIKIRSK